MTRSQGPVAELGVYPSKSNPSRTYSVWLGEDEVVYCDCWPWKRQSVPPADRKPCQHMIKWKGGDRGLM